MDKYLEEFCESPRISLLVIVFLILFMFTVSVDAGMVAKDRQGNAVWLYEDACTVGAVLARIHVEHQARFKKADLLYKGKNYAACWAVGLDGNIYVVDETGDTSAIPMQAFVPMVGS